MSRASQIIVLCEGKLDEVVIRRFLKKWGCSARNIRVPPYPQGAESAEAFVRREFPKQLQAFRSRSHHVSTALVVMTDADSVSVADRIRGLEEECRKSSLNPPFREEAVAFIIPKRHIETWLAYLDGKTVSESEQYKPQYEFKRCESECASLVDRLAEICKRGDTLENPPPSLEVACREFERIKHVLT